MPTGTGGAEPTSAYTLGAIVKKSNIAVEDAGRVYAELDTQVRAFTGIGEDTKDKAKADIEEIPNSLYEKLDQNIGDIRAILSRMSERLKAL